MGVAIPLNTVMSRELAATRVFRLPALLDAAAVESEHQRPIGPKTFFARPETAALRRAILERVTLDCPAISGWTVVLELGEGIYWHDHDFGANVISGAYYPQTAMGVLELETGERIEPEAGTLVMFDARLRHRVCPGPGRRLSVGFNITSPEGR